MPPNSHARIEPHLFNGKIALRTVQTPKRFTTATATATATLQQQATAKSQATALSKNTVGVTVNRSCRQVLQVLLPTVQIDG